MNYYKVTKETDVKEYLRKTNEKCLVIYSKTSIIKNNINLKMANFKAYSTKELTIKKDNIDNIINNSNNFSKIICIGGGTAIDIGKYLSKKYCIELICVPTMLSTNAYSTNKVALIVNGKKETLNAKIPDHILFDKNILKESKKENLYGVADIFSIYTALNDWLLAVEFNKESITQEFYLAQQLLNSTTDYILNNKIEEIEKNILYIYKCVGEAGEITNRYGSGKPESGSEHIFAKALEREIKIPHAVAVANGIMLMTYAQSLFLDNKLDYNSCFALQKLGIYELNKKYGITYDLISDVFLNLTPREDRFTVVNLIYKDEDLKKEILSKYKENIIKIGRV